MPIQVDIQHGKDALPDIHLRLKRGIGLHMAVQFFAFQIQKRYLTFRDANGRPFPETEASRRRAELYGQNTPWYDTGRLHESIHYKVHRENMGGATGDAYLGAQIIANAINPDTKEGYAAEVQRATNFMSLSSEDMMQGAGIVRDFVMRGKERRFRFNE